MCKRNLFTAIMIVGVSATVFAQKNKEKQDTTAVIKEFMIVCNQYKKLPLHLSLQQSNSVTFGEPEDSINANADIYMTEQGSYIKYGEMEQVVNDSMMLMVSQGQQVMMLYAAKQDIRQQLNSYLGFQLADSSVLRMAANYTAAFLPVASEDKKIIELRNRHPLPGTDKVKETITIRYDSKTKEPEQVIYMRRTLIPIDKTEWDNAPGHEGVSDKLVIIKDNYFLMNERKEVFDYKKISHDTAIRLPVSMTDRIRQDVQGKFIPARGFEQYYLSVE